MKRFPLLFAVLPFAVFAQDAAPAPQPSVMQTLLGYILPMVVTAIGAVGTWALKQLADYLKSKSLNSRVAGAFSIAVDYLETAFTHVRAGIEPDLKLALADGTLDEKERADLVKKLVELAKAELPTSIQTVLRATLGAGFDSWLSGKAGEAVQKVVMAEASPGELGTP